MGRSGKQVLFSSCAFVNYVSKWWEDDLVYLLLGLQERLGLSLSDHGRVRVYPSI